MRFSLKKIGVILSLAVFSTGILVSFQNCSQPGTVESSSKTTTDNSDEIPMGEGEGVVVPPAEPEVTATLEKNRIYRLRHPQGNYLYSRLTDEGVSEYGFSPEGFVFYLTNYYVSGNEAWTNAIYRCRSMENKHFLETSTTCKGQTLEGLLGYSSLLQNAGTYPLMEFYHPEHKIYFYTIEESEKTAVLGHGFQFVRTMGYVYK